MGSFRKRLLVLIIGLGVVTQTVTLAAVLISTRRNRGRPAPPSSCVSGGSLAEHLIGFRAGQLANGRGRAVLAADFGFREAVATADAPTHPVSGPQQRPAHRRRYGAACSTRTAGCSRRRRRPPPRPPDRLRV